MEKIVNKTINLNLEGVNGNAYFIMGVFKLQAKKEGWTQEEINLVLEEAKSKDYNYLLSTLQNHCEPIE